MIEMKTLTIGEGAQAKTYEIVDAAAREANETAEERIEEIESTSLFIDANGKFYVNMEDE